MGDWKNLYRPGTLTIWPHGAIADTANRLRATYDPVSQANCPAHITLTQPFLSPPDDHVLSTLVDIAADTAPFEICAGPIQRFGKSNVLKFDINPKGPILDLRHRLHDTGCFNLSLPFTEGFIPHMTISEYGPIQGESVTELAEELNKTTPTGRFVCSAFAFIVPDSNFVFSEQRRFHLGRKP